MSAVQEFLQRSFNASVAKFCFQSSAERKMPNSQRTWYVRRARTKALKWTFICVGLRCASVSSIQLLMMFLLFYLLRALRVFVRRQS